MRLQLTVIVIFPIQPIDILVLSWAIVKNAVFLTSSFPALRNECPKNVEKFNSGTLSKVSSEWMV